MPRQSHQVVPEASKHPHENYLAEIIDYERMKFGEGFAQTLALCQCLDDETQAFNARQKITDICEQMIDSRLEYHLLKPQHARMHAVLEDARTLAYDKLERYLEDPFSPFYEIQAGTRELLEACQSYLASMAYTSLVDASRRAKRIESDRHSLRASCDEHGTDDELASFRKHAGLPGPEEIDELRRLALDWSRGNPVEDELIDLLRRFVPHSRKQNKTIRGHLTSHLEKYLHEINLHNELDEDNG